MLPNASDVVPSPWTQAEPRPWADSLFVTDLLGTILIDELIPAARRGGLNPWDLKPKHSSDRKDHPQPAASDSHRRCRAHLSKTQLRIHGTGTGGTGVTVGVGVGVDVGSGRSGPDPWAGPPPGPSGWDIAELAAITPKPAAADVVVSTKMDKVAVLISLRMVLCSMVTPYSHSHLSPFGPRALRGSGDALRRLLLGARCGRHRWGEVRAAIVAAVVGMR
jgi:hypothetical protein